MTFLPRPPNSTESLLHEKQKKEEAENVVVLINKKTGLCISKMPVMKESAFRYDRFITP